MLTIEDYETQIKNLIVMIINKERKKINKWKNKYEWFSEDGLTNDVDVFYYIFNYIENQGGINNFMNYVYFVHHADPFNGECKWKTIKKKNEFFNDFLQ